MKKLWLTVALVCLMAGHAFGQAGAPSLTTPFARTFIFDASENSPCYRITDNSVQYHQIVFRTLGTVSAGTIKLSGYSSIDCSGSATDIIPATSWTASGETSITHGSYGSVKMVGASYSGTGTIVANYMGFIVKFEAVSDDCDGNAKSSARIVSDNTNNDDETEIKATAGTLCSVIASNDNATTAAWVKCTNLTAANTTPGSSAIFFDFRIPAASNAGISNINLPFSTALTCYLATGKAASDATDPAQDDVHVTITYK